ncbi:hypothetical protein M9H77_36618 [Catharanthus roseus]|uniref:Uncharacterized protein n=1 Tax=Catharanthus roseus TaxID=4058 RepID=A0ACB9ZSP9_CATRO|nr:hypothetical protein M9H77_36618 [Catharanthus roseus]
MLLVSRDCNYLYKSLWVCLISLLFLIIFLLSSSRFSINILFRVKISHCQWTVQFAGFEAPNFRRLADKIAEAGFLVVAPDFFYGDPLDIHNPNIDRAAWMKAHNAEKGCEDAMAVIDALKSEGVSAIGAAGFCWGGMAVVKLAKFDRIRAAVILHPGPITVEEINEVKVPTALLGAEVDHLCPAEHLQYLGEILSAKPEVDSFTKIYPGVKHGWTLMYNVDDEAAVKIAEEAHSDMLNWITKYM